MKTRHSRSNDRIGEATAHNDTRQDSSHNAAADPNKQRHWQGKGLPARRCV
jgi:hypothetical protein